MAHFAKVSGGVVETVIVAEQAFIDSGAVGDPEQWIQTSYNTRGGIHYDPITKQPSEDQTKALRKNYAGIGYTYNAALDAFIPPKYEWNASWELDPVTGTWVAPVPKPADGQEYGWDEATGTWVVLDYPNTAQEEGNDEASV